MSRAFIERVRKNEKGFTLVELIVVIVILGILLAILVPGIMRWIDKSRRVQYKVDCRTAALASDTVLTERYGALLTADVTDAAVIAEIEKQAGLDGTISDIVESGHLTMHLLYTAKDGTKVTYCREYQTCTEHGEVYNFEDSSAGGSGGTGGDPSDPGGDPDGGTPSDPSKPSFGGKDVDAIDGNRVPGKTYMEGQVFYMDDGSYYYWIDNNWAAEGSSINSYGSSYTCKIDPNKAPTSYSEMDGSTNFSTGEVVEYEGNLYVYISTDESQTKDSLQYEKPGNRGKWRPLK